jgi:hypothetical protein
MADEWRIAKDLEGSNRRLMKVLFQHVPGRTEETTKNFSQVRIARVPAESSPNIYRTQVSALTPYRPAQREDY